MTLALQTTEVTPAMESILQKQQHWCEHDQSWERRRFAFWTGFNVTEDFSHEFQLNALCDLGLFRKDFEGFYCITDAGLAYESVPESAAQRGPILANARHEYQCREREKEARQNPSHFAIGDSTPLAIIDHAWINGEGWEYRLKLRAFQDTLDISETDLLARIEETKQALTPKRKYSPYGGNTFFYSRELMQFPRLIDKLDDERKVKNVPEDTRNWRQVQRMKAGSVIKNRSFVA